MNQLVKERTNVLNVELTNKKGNNIEFKKGMIVFADLPSVGGSVQSGKRPVLIVSSNINNLHSPNLNVVAITTKIGKTLPVHVLLNKEDVKCLKFDSMCLCEQLLTIPKDVITRQIGIVPENVMNEINKAIMIQLAL